MEYEIRRIASHTAPLCFLPDGRLLCYHQGKAVVLFNDIVEKKWSLLSSRCERMLGWSKLLTRLMRFGVRATGVIDERRVVLSIGNKLKELDLISGELTDGFFCGEGIRPLNFSTIMGIEGFDDGIYFGGYLGNREMKPVNVYHRIGIDRWEIVYSFPQGSINHVHSIVSDPYRQCLWVFTGDFDEAAAIWKVEDNFKKVERIVCNNQKYRACSIFALPEGLLYATDAPFAEDYIYLMNPNTFDFKEIFIINGSCIYGCQWKDKYVFSSTVEGDGRKMSRFEWLFTRKRGNGIKDNYVHLYVGNLEEGFREIYKEKKDGLPLYPFQFGVFKFPIGRNCSNTLYFQPIATNKHDLDLMSFRDL